MFRGWLIKACSRRVVDKGVFKEVDKGVFRGWLIKECSEGG